MTINIVKCVACSRVNIRQVRAAARHQQIINMRKGGLTYAAIGLKLGISRERVRQILNVKFNNKRGPPRTSQPLRVSDVAHLLNIHANTVRRWSDNGIIKAYRIGPRGDRRFEQNYIKRLSKKGTSG